MTFFAVRLEPLTNRLWSCTPKIFSSPKPVLPLRCFRLKHSINVLY